MAGKCVEKDSTTKVARSWGCVKLSDFLTLQGISVSSPTVQKILIRNDMASVYDRWLKVEERYLETGIELTVEK